MSSKPLVVGLIGKIGSGKSTAAEVFKQKGFVPYAFADPIKEICHQVFNIPRDVLWGPSEKRTGEVRQMLQHLGTDFARKFYPDIWVDKLMEKIQREDFPTSVITDVRFPNEAERIIYELGGTLIEITRPNNHNTSTTETEHTSEVMMSFIGRHLIKYEIINDESLDQFKNAIEQIADEIINAAATR
jgi:hypothetical protein